MASDETKILLRESEMPQRWYNIQPDLPAPLAPPLHPGTGKPLGPADLAPIFPMELIKQEVTQEPVGRDPGRSAEGLPHLAASPLLPRASPGEGPGHTRSHLLQGRERQPGGQPQAEHLGAAGLLQQAAGREAHLHRDRRRPVGERARLRLHPLRHGVHGLHGARELRAEALSPHAHGDLGRDLRAFTDGPTNAGRQIRKSHPDTPGSLGIAISEAVEDAATHEDTKYSLGSVLNHVLLHQTIVGLEAKEQLKLAGEKRPDVIVGCVGGGSNFGGIAFPFVKDKLKGAKMDILAIEPKSCPSLTVGSFRYDFGDTAQLTPLLKMYTLGHTFMPEPIHAGGLRYHGMAPLVSLLANQKVIEPRAVPSVCHLRGGADLRPHRRHAARARRPRTPSAWRSTRR